MENNILPPFIISLGCFIQTIVYILQRLHIQSSLKALKSNLSKERKFEIHSKNGLEVNNLVLNFCGCFWNSNYIRTVTCTVHVHSKSMIILKKIKNIFLALLIHKNLFIILLCNYNCNLCSRTNSSDELFWKLNVWDKSVRNCFRSRKFFINF